MDFIGFDLGKVSSQICILTEDGELIERRVRTDCEHIYELLAKRSTARVVIESSTGSEWVARYLEEIGLEVVVADPNFSPMYATRSRRVKTDRRDARTLAEACRLGAYRLGAPHVRPSATRPRTVGRARGGGAHPFALHLADLYAPTA